VNKKPTTPIQAELKPHLFGNTGLGKSKFSNKNLTNTTENPKYGILNQSVSSLKGPLFSKKRNAAEAGLSRPMAGQFQTKKLKLEGGFRARAPGGGGAGAPPMNFIERNKQKIKDLQHSKKQRNKEQRDESNVSNVGVFNFGLSNVGNIGNIGYQMVTSATNKIGQFFTASQKQCDKENIVNPVPVGPAAEVVKLFAGDTGAR